MIFTHPDTILPARDVGRKRRRAGTALLLLFVVLMLMTLAVGPVGAASPAATGWWWRPQAGAGGILIPNPPSVPPDGLAVGGAPDGQSAIAAVRYALLSGESPIKLTLLTSGETGGEVAAITACPAGSAWEPAQAGKWDTRPQAACGVANSAGIRATDGSSWTFNLSAFPPTVPGFLDVVLISGNIATPGGGVPPTFQVAFKKPDASSLQTIQPIESSGSEYASLGESSFAPLSSEPFAPAPAVEAPPSTELVQSQSPIAPSARQLASQGGRPVDNIPTASRVLFPIVFVVATVHFGYAYMRSRQASRVLV